MNFKALFVIVLLAFVGQALGLSENCKKKCSDAQPQKMCGIIANASSTKDPETFPSKCAFDCAVNESKNGTSDGPIALLCQGNCSQCRSSSPYCQPKENRYHNDCGDLRANVPVCSYNKTEYANTCAINCENQYRYWLYNSGATTTLPTYDYLRCYSSCANCIS